MKLDMYESTPPRKLCTAAPKNPDSDANPTMVNPIRTMEKLPTHSDRVLYSWPGSALLREIALYAVDEQNPIAMTPAARSTAESTSRLLDKPLDLQIVVRQGEAKVAVLR